MKFLLKRLQHALTERAAWMPTSILAWLLGQASAWSGIPSTALPVGGAVSQGAATINTSGSQLTVNQTSANASITWSSFNIGSGATVTFNQPSASSVAWNNINDANPSQIFGSLNANGFVVLENANGFYIGGSASINTHGLGLTTAAAPNLSLGGGGAWQFDAPPPAASIINYGQINISGGGSLFLIANDIENRAGIDSQGNSSVSRVGTLSAPGGQIGLYAGQQILLSVSPDGRGLSAKVTLPQGSVDNQGHLIADAGSIVAQAQTVNNTGLIQANSVQNNNGVIELVASESVNLGAGSDLEAHGDNTSASASPGGFAGLQAGTTFSDIAGSKINVAGGTGAGGGQAGIVEILGPNLDGTLGKNSDANSVHSTMGNDFATLINPVDLSLSSDPTDTSSSSPNFNVADLSVYSQIDLHVLDSIELSTLWVFNDLSAPGALSLTAANNIILDDGTGIQTGKNLSVNLTAGTQLANGSQPMVGSDGIYLNGSSYISTVDGDINLWAANEVIVNSGSITTGINLAAGSVINSGSGGNINVTALHGDVNTGSDVLGYDFGQSAAPYYQVDLGLGGISTAAGGNVTINAGGNVISFLPIQTGNPQDYVNAQYDGGTGAFGPQAGNVTINAGGDVYGHYVVANGVGNITAGANIGAALPVLANNPGEGFALSLVKGSWNVSAPNGSIYVQDIRNPNGIFGESQNGISSSSSAASYAGYHFFDYDSNASVLLDAADTVEFTGYEAPHKPASANGAAIPFLLPPILDVMAGAGGFILDTSVILFPSPDQGLSITTLNGGNFGIPNSVDPDSASPVTLEMSDSSATRWVDLNSFNLQDHATTSTELSDPNSITLSIAGSMNAVNLYATKAAQITVDGDMINSGFVGENLHAGDITSVNVTGKIYNSPIYTFVSLSKGNAITSANPNQPSAWDSVFDLALNPSMVASLSSQVVKPLPTGNSTLAYYLNHNNDLLFPSGPNTSTAFGSNPGFVYDPASLQLGFAGSMSSLTQSQIAALKGGTITVLAADQEGKPIIDSNGHLEMLTYHFSAASVIATLYNESLDSTLTTGLGLQVGGPGAFTVHSASIDLGNTAGIGSDGFGSVGFYGSLFSYASLHSLLPTAATGGASVTINVDGNLTMATSGIYSRDGGNVNVNVGGEIDLSQGTFIFPTDDCFGIYTSGHSDVSVTATGDINVGSSRIASFNGGNVQVESLDGDVNAGSGGNIALVVYGFVLNPVTGTPQVEEFGNLTDLSALSVNPAPYGSGIMAEYPTKEFQAAGGNGKPGNITILTPKGDITSSLGGISQFALDQNLSGPTVTLEAGTTGVKATAKQGNISLGQGGVVGGTVDITASGEVNGFIVSRQNANINAVQGFSGTVLAGGSANFSGGPVSGLVVGIGGISISGPSTATLLSQDVSAGGVSQDTLGSSASGTSASSSAAGEASADTKQQVASNDNGSDDEKKKKKLQPLMQKSKRVTVILPKI
jgi:filamentous hemagglutinin family protein